MTPPKIPLADKVALLNHCRLDTAKIWYYSEEGLLRVSSCYGVAQDLKKSAEAGGYDKVVEFSKVTEQRLADQFNHLKTHQPMADMGSAMKSQFVFGSQIAFENIAYKNLTAQVTTISGGLVVDEETAKFAESMTSVAFVLSLFFFGRMVWLNVKKEKTDKVAKEEKK